MLHAGETLLEELGISSSVRRDPLMENELMILNLDRLSMARVGGSSCNLLSLERGVESGAVLVMNNNCNEVLECPSLGVLVIGKGC